MIFLAIRREGNRRAGYWLGLSAVFLFLSADEGSCIHEKMGQLGKFILAAVGIEQGGFLDYAWVVPGAALVLAYALLSYLRKYVENITLRFGGKKTS